VIYVLDASAAIDLLVRSDPGERVRQLLQGDEEAALVTVTHLDAEVLSGLARLHRAGELAADEVSRLIHRLGSLAMRRVPITTDLLQAAWLLRDNVAARDALYVAAARGLDAWLITTDERLGRAVPDLVASQD
jgi:predicted nucleic acid-binding protein